MTIAKISLSLDGAKTVVSGLKDVGSTIGDLTGSIKGLTAIGGTLSIAAFSTWIKGSIDAADATSKLAAKSGLLVKDVAGLQLAYQLAGLESDNLTSSMSRLSKGIVEGNKALEAMGIRSKNARGEFKNTKDVLYEVADAFQGLPDGAQKTSLALELFGKTGADMIPLLNGGAEGMREMAETAERLGLVIGDQTAKEAEAFNDTMDLVGMGLQGVSRGVAAQLLPTLSSLAASFLESMTSGDKLQKIAGFLGTTLKGLYSVGVSVVEIFNTMGKVWGGVVGAIVAAMSGEFKLAKNILGEMMTDVGAGWADTAKTIARAWTTVGNDTVAAQAKIVKSTKLLSTDTAAAEKASKDAAKQAKSELDTLQKAAEERSKLRNAEYNAIEEYLRQEEAKRIATVKAANESVQAAQDEYDNYGKTRSQIAEVSLARLRDQLVATDAGTAINRSIQQQIEAQEKLIDIYRKGELREESVKAAQEASDAWKKSSTEIADWLGDGLARGFGKGKSLIASLLDSIKASAARLVLNPIIQPFAAIGASFLNPTAAQAAGSAASSFGQTGNLFSAGKTLWDGFNSGFTAAGGQVAQYVQSGINLVSGSGGMVSQGPIQVGSFAQGVGTAASYLGGASVGVYGGRAISNGYAISGSGNGVVNAGTAIGAVLGGPIGAAIGGLIGGAANRLFGRRPKEYTTAGIQGNFNQEGFTDAKNFQRWEQKGGVFRSDKDGTDYTVLAAEFAQTLGDGFKALKSTTSDFAQSLGLNAGLIAGYAKGMVIDLTGDQVKDAEILAKTFGDMGDEMATILLPNFKEFQKTGETASATLSRLASVNQTVDGVFGAIGIDAVAAFNGLGVAAAKAKQRLIDVAGGMDAFLAKSTFFVSNFLSEAEQLKPASDRVAAVFARHKIAGDISKDDFAVKVKNALLDTSDAGQAMANDLLDIAPLFLQVANFAAKSATVLDTVTDSIDTAADTIADAGDTIANAADKFGTAMSQVDKAFDVVQRAVDAERAEVTKIYEDRVGKLNQSIDKLKGLSSALNSALDRRGLPSSFASNQSDARAQITTALAIARAGGVFPDANTLSKALEVISQPSEQLYTTFQEYQRQYLKDSNNIRDLAELTDGQLSVEERTLTSLQEQHAADMKYYNDMLASEKLKVDALNGLNTKAQTLSEAMAGLNGAIFGAMQVKPAPAAGANGGSGTASAVAALYDQFSDRTYMTAEGKAYWEARVASGESPTSIAQSFQDSVKAVRGYADGGLHPGGLRLVGENGPELEVTGPSAILSNSMTNDLFSRLRAPATNTTRLEAVILSLQAQVALLKSSAEKTATAVSAQEAFLRRISPDGNSINVKVTA